MNLRLVANPSSNSSNQTLADLTAVPVRVSDGMLSRDLETSKQELQASVNSGTCALRNLNMSPEISPNVRNLAPILLTQERALEAIEAGDEQFAITQLQLSHALLSKSQSDSGKAVNKPVPKELIEQSAKSHDAVLRVVVAQGNWRTQNDYSLQAKNSLRETAWKAVDSYILASCA